MRPSLSRLTTSLTLLLMGLHPASSWAQTKAAATPSANVAATKEKSADSAAEKPHEKASDNAEGTGPGAAAATPAATSPATAESPSAASTDPAAPADGELMIDESTATDSTKPIPESDVPARRSSLMRTTKSSQYSVPLSFEPGESSLILPNPEIEYDLTLDKGAALRMGNILLSEKTFVFAVRPLASFGMGLGGMIGPEAGKPSLILRWPEALLRHGTLEMISRNGDVVWKTDISESDIERWKNRLVEWRAALKRRKVPDAQLKTGLFATSFVLEDLEAKGLKLNRKQESFRFCLTQMEGPAQTRLCSQRLGVVAGRGSVSIQNLPSETTARVLVMNRPGELKGVVTVPVDSPSQFYADLAGGESFEFMATPSKLDLVDISDTTKEGVLRVSGFGVRPTDLHLILNPERYSRVTVMMGFEPTIGDKRKFWAASLRTAAPRLYFPGEGGGIFRQRFELAQIPRATTRIHLDRRTPTGTYSDSVVLSGRKQPDTTVTSDQYFTTATRDPALFTWTFKATEVGEMNRSCLTVGHEGKNYRSFFEMYRAHANELSGRFSVIYASGKPLIMGEVAFNRWFENLFWIDSDLFTNRRWGISGKYFKSMTQLTVGANGQKANLDVLTLDTKMRMTPGLWTRDGSSGLMLSYQSVNFDLIKAAMLGGGAFWARSMPRIIDDVFNRVPFLNYPKWIDVELVAYMTALNSDIKLKSNWALNFHGQVLWSKNVFGEAGMGFKFYNIQNEALSKEAKLDTFYSTFGLGMKF